MALTPALQNIYRLTAPKLTATAPVAQSVEIQGRGFNSQPEALELHFSQLVLVGSENVYLSDTRIYLTLKNLSIFEMVCLFTISLTDSYFAFRRFSSHNA